MAADDREPNRRFRDARLQRSLTREQLADSANRLLPPSYLLTASEIARIERGGVDWPRAPRRAALRTVLGVGSDSELGFANKRRRGSDNHAVDVNDDRRLGVPDTVDFVRRRDVLGGLGAGMGAFMVGAPQPGLFLRAAATAAGEAPHGDDGLIGGMRRDVLLTRRLSFNGEAPPLAEVEAQIRGAIRSYQAADYSALGRLPEVVTGAEQIVVATSGEEQVRPYRALAWANLTASKLAAKVGDSSLAWIVADRAASCAVYLSDAPLAGVAAYQTACALTQSPNGLESAEQVVLIAADQLASHRSHSHPAHLSVLGALLLQAAVIAAKQGQPNIASERLNHAARLAADLRRDANELWTAFGPTNVELHRLAVAVELGATKLALTIGDRLDTSGLPRALRSRRAQIHLDLAAAHVARPDTDPQVVLHLLEAERIAPQAIRHNAKARGMLSVLLGRERRSAVPGLRPLAQRAGMAA